MLRSSHCLRTDSSLSLCINLGDCSSCAAKAVLKKIPFQRQLADRPKHLVVLLLESLFFLLHPAFFLLRINEHLTGVLNELFFPVPNHVGIQAVLCCDLSQLSLSCQNLKDDLGLILCGVRFLCHCL